MNCFCYFGVKIDKMKTKTSKQKETTEPVIRSIANKGIETFGSLGKEVYVSPKSQITVNKAGLKIEFFTETVEVLIGIGKDHVAYLMMDKDAWEALKSGEEVHIETLRSFKKKFL